MRSTWNAIFLSLLLITSVFAQTDFKNTCQTDSLLPLLATGLITMDIFDSSNGGANKDVYRDLTLSKFTKTEVLGFAFALTAFDGPCGQPYYTLVIDKVEFQNDNTRMRVVVNYRSTIIGVPQVLTRWTKVSYTYIVVSRTFSGAYSDIWANTVEVQGAELAAANTGPVAVDLNALIFTSTPIGPPTATCTAYVDPNFAFQSGAATCSGGNIALAPTNLAGGRLIIHAYIMGFGWDPSRSTDRILAASVFNQNYATFATAPETFANQGEAILEAANVGAVTANGGLFQITYRVPTTVTAAGPQVSIFNFNGALQYIKIGFVYTRFNNQLDPVGPLFTFATTAQQPIRSYYSDKVATIGQLPYTNSYFFDRTAKFNAPVNVLRSKATGEWNRYYFTLPDTRYAIYGLSSFDLPLNSGATCSSNINIEAKLNSINSYTINTINSSPTNFVFTADVFTVNHFKLCNPTPATKSTIMTAVSRKSYFTVPTLSRQQYILEVIVPSTASAANLLLGGISGVAADVQKAIHLGFVAASNGASDEVQFKADFSFINLTPNAPLKFQFGWASKDAFTGASTFGTTNIGATTVGGMRLNANYTITFSVNGMVMYTRVYVGLGTSADKETQIFRGININSNTATVTVDIKFLRSGAAAATAAAVGPPIVLAGDIAIITYARLAQYARAYDPATGCCVTGCPANTGLNVVIDPPTCVACNAQSGLVFSPSSGTCTCLRGFYLDSNKTFQCYPCTALYCDICDTANPASCTTCAAGASRNALTNTCACSVGYYPTGTTCTVCPIACQTCSAPTGACLTCVNADLRDINRNCICIDGYFDNKEVNCVKCSSTCATCSSAAACTTCLATNFRVLQGNVCLCIPGYYELYNADNSRTCQKCNPECLTCNISPANCLTCDATRNRFLKLDDNGNPSCFCNPGFYSTDDGSCIQANCNADPFCSQCEQGLRLCVQCLSARNRIIKLPESICVCMDGFYPDLNNNCVPCSSGCLICRSATVCTSCVALATPSTAIAGQCACPDRTFFLVSPSGTRYCANCGPNCLSCTSETSCTTCLPSFNRLADGSCQCPNRFFVNPAGACVPCAGGCNICTSFAVCTQCITSLVLQGNGCQANCNNGFTPLGNRCVSCSEGCLQCSQNLICFYCADNLFMYRGSCFDICPAGTIGDRSSGDWKCIPCNSPCKTCLNHPSYCTSCENGKGYLQTSAVQQSCVTECTDGTYVKNGVCQVCDFKCATCLGAESNCISCPRDQILYNGGCWARCPAILISGSAFGNTNNDDQCVQNCPDGFYKVSASECSPCAPQCRTCSTSPTNCTSCLQGSVTLAGTCSVKCGQNQFSFGGICIACSSSCYGCSITPTNCVECADGFVLSGSICQKGCLRNQFFDNNRRQCVNCPSVCASCSSATNCTSCTNTNITPRGGVCANCPYPCLTCDATGVCLTCLSGFYFFQGVCQQTCPAGSSPVNNVCTCNSGVVSNGRCVTACTSGFTPINGNCIPCNPNCAQCSGNANTCTACVSGFAVDQNTKTCVSATQCNYGQESDGGVCTNLCDQGFYYYDSNCLFGECLEGYEPNAFGGCVRSSAAPTGQCQDNEFRQNGRCVAECSVGFYPDFVNGVCSPCSENCASCFNNNFCVNCLAGFQNTNGDCVQAVACGANQLQYARTCVSSCPVGTFQMGSQCFRRCAPDLYFYLENCYISCPAPILRTADACVATCPTGTINRNGICS